MRKVISFQIEAETEAQAFAFFVAIKAFMNYNRRVKILPADKEE